MSQVPETSLALLRDFFNRPLAQQAVQPLREGIEISVYIDELGPVCLTKKDGRTAITEQAPAKPDMSFWVTTPGIQKLSASQATDIGEIGIEICKLMISSDPKERLKASVHIGLFDLLRNGYLGVIPLGGASLMKFLGTQGFGSIGKIKDAISKLRTK
jgi:hypothetical protein